MDATKKEIKMMREGGFEIEGALDMVLPILGRDVKELWPNGNFPVLVTVEPISALRPARARKLQVPERR
jgi:hypothetical protein